MINNLSRSFSFKEAYIYIFSFFKYFIHFEILLYAFYMSYFYSFPFLLLFYKLFTQLSLNYYFQLILLQIFLTLSATTGKKRITKKISPNNKFKVKKSKESKLVINFWNSFLWQIIPRI